jgi:hypothetical protein
MRLAFRDAGNRFCPMPGNGAFLRHIVACTDCQATGQIPVTTDECMVLVLCPSCDGRRFTVTLDIDPEIGFTTSSDPLEGW